MKHLFFFKKQSNNKVINDDIVERKYENLQEDHPCITSFFKPLIYITDNNDKTIIKFRILQLFKSWNLQRIERIQDEDAPTLNPLIKK